MKEKWEGKGNERGVIDMEGDECGSTGLGSR